jgi:hypothetical protein
MGVVIVDVTVVYVRTTVPSPFVVTAVVLPAVSVEVPFPGSDDGPAVETVFPWKLAFHQLES